MTILSTYNQSPPPDDGSQTATNAVTWASIKEKLTDPLKDWIESPDLDGNEFILDADGDTTITADTDDKIDIKIGGTDSINIGHGVGNTGAFLNVDPGSITATANVSFGRLRVRNTNAVIIPSGTTAVVASAYFREPNITATGTVTAAATVYIQDAPTEGGSNYALWVDSGNVQFDGNLVVSGTITAASVSETGTAWTTPAFDAGNFTASGSMTWTVGSGDVTTYAYKQVGKTMYVMFDIATSTVGGTPSTSLRIAIPNSKTATKQARALGFCSDNGGSIEVATIGVDASGTVINIAIFDGSNWAASTNQTRVAGQIFFEVN